MICGDCVCRVYYTQWCHGPAFMFTKLVQYCVRKKMLIILRDPPPPTCAVHHLY